MRRIRFLVEGRVQGVGFRAQTRAEAARLGLVGFVHNRADGAVDGEAEGPAEQVAQFAQWLQHGPKWANVERVAVEDLALNGSETRFEVRR